MIIDCISDLHGCKPALQGGDLLIVAGDLTARDTIQEYLDFNKWLSKQKYDRIIVIAGNHDGLVEKGINVEIKEGHSSVVVPILADRTIYLQDSACDYQGLKIWGSPWTPTFYDWHFMKDRGAAIKEKWDLIPSDTDILITHGPPFGILDQVSFSSKGRGVEKFAGCEELREAMFRIKPKLHVFGHIHAQGGEKVDRLHRVADRDDPVPADEASGGRVLGFLQRLEPFPKGGEKVE